MTQLLISVSNVAEARIAAENGADIIDLKDPQQGALGALPLTTINAVMQYMRNDQSGKPVSATIGDVPMDAGIIVEQIKSIANTGVDFIKIGFFEADDYTSCLGALKPLIQSGVQLIVVLFAEYRYPETLVDDICESGFVGLMLDTVHKQGRTIRYYHSHNDCLALSTKIKNNGLAFGLAGSLRLQDIEDLKDIEPTYMGFRGGVCEQNSRKANLDIEKIKSIRKAL